MQIQGNSELANKIFSEELNTYKPIPEIKKLYTAVLLEAYKSQTGGAATAKTKILAQIAEYEKKLSVARDLLVAEKIDVEDYNMMKIVNSTILKSLKGNSRRSAT